VERRLRHGSLDLTRLEEEHQQGALLAELAPDLMQEIARLRAE
jgi:hypothetical protein